MKTAILALALSTWSTLALANPWQGNDFETDDRAVELGETFLMNRRDADYIPVRGGSVCNLSAFQIAIRGDGAKIDDLRVVFGNGRTQDMPVRQNFNAGENSRWIDLRGDDRCIKGVFIFGKSRSGNPRQTRVILRGMKDGRQDENDGVFLGRTKLENRSDLDFIDLRGQNCGLQKFKIAVRGDAARIDYLMLQFANGGTQRIDVRERFENGSSSAWKDLAGNRRCIDKVFIAGKSANDRARQSVVEFWGQF